MALQELRLQYRAPPAWVITALLTLVTVATVASRWGLPADGTAAALTVTQGETLFAVVLLLVPTLARDTRRRFSPLLWIRPLAPVTCALGKGLAGATRAILVILPPLLASWPVVGIVWGPPALWLPRLGIVATAALLAALFSSLLPWPLLGALLSAGILVYLTFLQTLLSLTDLAARTIYTSPAIGFGPDGALLLAQRFACAALALLELSLLPLIVQVRERRGPPGALGQRYRDHGAHGGAGCGNPLSGTAASAAACWPRSILERAPWRARPHSC